MLKCRLLLVHAPCDLTHSAKTIIAWPGTRSKHGRAAQATNSACQETALLCIDCLRGRVPQGVENCAYGALVFKNVAANDAPGQHSGNTVQ